MGILSSIFDKLCGRGSSQQVTGAQPTTAASSQPSGQAGQQALENVDVDKVLADMWRSLPPPVGPVVRHRSVEEL